MLRSLTTLLLLLLFFPAGPAMAQSAGRGVPNVYLDCQRCDFNYIRTNIEFVHYVRDQDDADIYLRITDAPTSGGREYTLHFRGIGTYASRSDTLKYRTRDTDSADEERSGLVRYIKIGLVPFASATSAIENLDIFYDAPPLEEEPEEEIDPWNGWVFDINVSGWVNGHSSERNMGFHTGLYAERVTDKVKILTRLRGDISRRRLELSDRIAMVNRDWGEYWGLIAYSLHENFAIGLYSRVNFHRPDNIRLNVEASPAIEYNVFPYSEYQERRIVVRYRVTPIYREYFQETVYFKTAQTMLHQSLHTQVRYDQPWGRIDFSVNASNFFHDTAINRLEFWPSLNIRIIRGLSVNMSGRYRIINDQISLPAGEISDDCRTLGSCIVPTSFDYSVSVGLNYTFGSIFNHAVNQRF